MREKRFEEERKSGFSALQSELTEKDNEIIKIKEILSKLQEEFKIENAKFSTEQDTWQRLIVVKEEERKNFEATVRALQLELQERSEKIKEFEFQIVELRKKDEELKVYQQELNDIKRELNSKEIEKSLAVEKKEQERKSAVERLEQDLTARDAELSEMRGQIQKFRFEISERDKKFEEEKERWNNISSEKEDVYRKLQNDMMLLELNLKAENAKNEAQLKTDISLFQANFEATLEKKEEEAKNIILKSEQEKELAVKIVQGKSVDQERKYRDEKEELLKAIATREEEKRAVLSELTLKEAQAKSID